MNYDNILIRLNGSEQKPLPEIARELNMAKSQVFAMLYKQKQDLTKAVVSLTAKPHPTAFERYDIKLIEADIVEKLIIN